METGEPRDDLLTIHEAAQFLRVNFQTVYRLVRAGRLPAQRVGRQWRMRRSDLLAYTSERPRAQTSPAPQRRPPSVAAPRPAPAERRIRVLVVDDEQVNAQVLARLLELIGHEAIAITSGEEAISIVREQPIDFVFLDLMMPGMNGVETLRVLRALNPDLPVVIVTGYADHPMAAEALELGPVVLLRKPVTSTDLYHALRLLHH